MHKWASNSGFHPKENQFNVKASSNKRNIEEQTKIDILPAQIRRNEVMCDSKHQLNKKKTPTTMYRYSEIMVSYAVI